MQNQAEKAWPADYNAVLSEPHPLSQSRLGRLPEHDKGSITSMRWSTIENHGSYLLPSGRHLANAHGRVESPRRRCQQECAPPPRWGHRGRPKPRKMSCKRLLYNGLLSSKVPIATWPCAWAKRPPPNRIPTWVSRPLLGPKNTRSPRRGRSPGPSSVVARRCSSASLGRSIPCSAMTCCTKPEQSNPDGVRPPHE